MSFTFAGIMLQVEQSYNNTAAHTELKAMMNRNERLSLYFTIDRYGDEAIRVESKTTKNFAYQIDQEAFAWVMNYLMKGETEDFNVKPDAVANFRNGTVLFFMERDEEITSYLRERGLIR